MTMIACAWHLPTGTHIARYSRCLTLFALSRMDVLDEDIQAAELMVSELATNAYQHADPPYVLRLWCSGRIAMVEVLDSTPELPTPRGIVTAEAIESTDLLHENGRGLALVRDISGGRWGADRTASGSGKIMWFALPRACEQDSPMNPSMLAITPSTAQLALA